MYCFYYTRKNSPPKYIWVFHTPTHIFSAIFQEPKADTSQHHKSLSLRGLDCRRESHNREFLSKLELQNNKLHWGFSLLIQSVSPPFSCADILSLFSAFIWSFLLSCYRAHFAVRTKLIVFALIGYKHILSLLSVWVTVLNLLQRKALKLL